MAIAWTRSDADFQMPVSTGCILWIWPNYAAGRMAGRMESRRASLFSAALPVEFPHLFEIKEFFQKGCFHKSFIKQLTCPEAGRISRDRCVDKVGRRGGSCAATRNLPCFLTLLILRKGCVGGVFAFWREYSCLCISFQLRFLCEPEKFWMMACLCCFLRLLECRPGFRLGLMV